MSNIVQNHGLSRGVATSFSLVAGLSTLTCCALPALFISLGLGASLASLVSSMPWLIVLSENKTIVFSVALFSLITAAWLQWQARNQACPAGGFQAKYCSIFRQFSWAVIGLSALAILVGAYFAFAAISSANFNEITCLVRHSLACNLHFQWL